MAEHRIAILFDIDGTLIVTGGAGAASWRLAFDELYGPGDQHFTGGPRNHEFLQEMYREVFAGRDAHVLTVGEMPGVTIPQAVLFTDPGRHELDEDRLKAEAEEV